jgi:NADH dehydrogenase
LIFGPGDRFALEFASWMQKRLPIPLIGKGDYQLMPVGRTDLCRGMVKLLFDAKSSNRIYQIGGPQKLSYLETLKIIEKSSGAKMRLMKIPAALILFASAILGRFKWFPVTKDMVRMLLKGSVTEQNDFWSETGIKPASLSEALPEYLLAENSSR